MILSANLKKILIIDFGSQFTQLIARRIRELDVFSVILPWDISKERIIELNPVGVLTPHNCFGFLSSQSVLLIFSWVDRFEFAPWYWGQSAAKTEEQNIKVEIIKSELFMLLVMLVFTVRGQV